MPRLALALFVVAATATDARRSQSRSDGAGARQCRIDVLERDVAKEIAGDLREATRFGCQYSGVDCSVSSSVGVTLAECELVKGPDDGADGTRCDTSILLGEIQRGLAKDVAKAARKFNCQVDSLACSADTNHPRGFVVCTANGGVPQNTPPRGHADGGRSKSRRSSGGCDTSLLTDSVAHELASHVGKAQRRYGCPAVAAVDCEVDPASNWVDCTLAVAPGATLAADCDMDWLTADASEDVAEELADAATKYGCVFPPRVSCTSSAENAAFPRFECVLGERVQASNQEHRPEDTGGGRDGTPSSGAGASTQQTHESTDATYKRKWTHRHIRGHHGNL